MSRSMTLCACLLALLPGVVAADTIPADSPRWEIQAKTSRVEEHLERPGLYVEGGYAYIMDAEFTDGTIEFDIAFDAARGFMGAAFRIVDPGNLEHFYVRPHQSGHPDANQYTPIFNGVSAWQLYHGPGYGVPVTYDYDQWIPVKIVVLGQKADIYIGDMSKPTLHVSELKRERSAGGVGVNASFAPAHFSNFSFDPTPPTSLVGEPAPAKVAEPGTISSWDVSEAFAVDVLAGTHRLPDTVGRSWQKLEIEKTGLANLARIQGTGDGNTVLARTTIDAKTAEHRVVTFGYSDDVRVYLNGQLLYQGSNLYRSRDFRYLGTIGLFDAVILPLHPGENQLIFAVTENFGGWGLMATLGDATRSAP